MTKTMIAIWMAASFTIPAIAADNYTIDPKHTFPGFEISHLGFSIQRGRFNHTTGKLTMDPGAGIGSLDIEVDAASINTGLDELENQLRS